MGISRGEDNCCDIGGRSRIERGMHQGQEYDLCRAMHAEASIVGVICIIAGAIKAKIF